MYSIACKRCNVAWQVVGGLEISDEPRSQNRGVSVIILKEGETKQTNRIWIETF